MNVLGQHTMVFGKKKEGKSNFVQWLITEHIPNHLVYDICREHNVDGVNRYLPEHRSGEEARAEFGGVIEKLVTENDRSRRPDLVVGEEMSRTAPSGGGTHDAVWDLIDLNRHYDVGILGVARRPAQVDTTAVELADNLIVFYVDGHNDVSKLNSIKDGLGDRAAALEPYHFLRVTGREVQKHSPVPEMDTTGEL